MVTRAGLDAETIVQKASEPADRDGLGALSMATLASSLGVRPPFRYRCFRKGGPKRSSKAATCSDEKKRSSTLKNGKLVAGEALDTIEQTC